MRPISPGSRPLPRHLRDIAVAILLACACSSSGSGGADAVDAGVDLSAPGPDLGADVLDVAPAPDLGPPDLRTIGPDAVDGQAPLEFPPPGRQRLRGHLIFGNELYAFQACGSPALIWADLQGGEPGIEKLKGLGECTPDAGFCGLRTIYVELDATVSPPCQCGHLGQYERSLRIQELLTAASVGPPDCPHAAPRFPMRR